MTRVWAFFRKNMVSLFGLIAFLLSCNIFWQCLCVADREVRMFTIFTVSISMSDVCDT